MRESDLTVPGSVEETAWAKINLTLGITGRRADGYHELTSLTVFADYGDRLRFSESDDLTLAIDGPFAKGLTASADNLVLRAARGLGGLTGRPVTAAIALTKNLPVAAGIGGGSADAAAALRGLCRLLDLSPDRQALHDLALQLGADVPVCLDSRSAVMSGVGERLQPATALPALALVLVNPSVPLSTAAVFKARRGAFSPPDASPPPVDPETLLDWLAQRPNDLEAPAKRLRREIAEVLQRLDAAEGCRLSRMSGSGATCFGVYETRAAAEAAAKKLGDENPQWWVQAASLL